MRKQILSKPKLNARKIAALAMFCLAFVLLVTSVAGYILRGSQGAKSNLYELRTDAVVHQATQGLIDEIARQARADKLQELRADKANFRKMGENKKNELLDEAEFESRAEAEALYGDPEVADREAFNAAVEELEGKLKLSSGKRSEERSAFAEAYIGLVDNVGSWTQIVDGSDSDDEIFAELCKVESDLKDTAFAHMKTSFVNLAKTKAEEERKKLDKELYQQLENEMTGAVGDWAGLNGLDDDALWAEITKDVPAAAEREDFKTDLLAKAHENISNTLEGVELIIQQADSGTSSTAATLADYAYFEETDALKALNKDTEAAYDVLWAEIVKTVPELDSLGVKLKQGIRDSIESVVWPGGLDFSDRYNAYTGVVGTSEAEGSTMLASQAENLLLMAIALVLLGAVFFFWDSLTVRFGVPRTIITLFFIYLCLAARFYDISVPMMMGNVLERMTMYGILVLAMMPGIQCGIGLNMGMTIGCIAGLFGIVISLQYNMVGAPGLIVACLVGVTVATPLGWLYSKLLNRMKGNEMTISTYVGFSFVSLMCIGWMMLPFTNPKIIWLLSGRGLRVTHSLLGSYAHLLDKWLSFEIGGITVPTSGLLFLALCCLIMWLFSRSRVGIAMSAAGSNPRFAQASGISVNSMRTLGTVLSTVLAAIGIVIYSQSFGYAQLYTAPRQLGFIAASAILIGGATVRRARVSHVIIGVFLFEGVLVFGQQIANAAVSGGGLSEVMRIMISNGIILYALTQTGGAHRD